VVDESEAGAILLSIRDTGTGMGPDLLSRIFEPFFTTKQPGLGTGMGLSAVLGTVQSHGGSVDVQSSLGEGSTFTFRLPLATDQQQGEAVAVVKMQRGSGRVLVVDDESTVRLAVSRVLTHLGYMVHTCSSGAEATEYVAAHAREVDLVLLDLILPNMSGTAVLKRLRELKPDVRVVILSGFSDSQGVEELLAAGARAMVRKPFTAAELSQAIAAHIGVRAASDTDT